MGRARGLATTWSKARARVRARAPRRGRVAQAGLTLVELMVSILLASILSAGLFYLLSGQSKTYDQQFATLSTQENLWGAMQFLQRQIRLAGYGISGCPGGGSVQILGTGATTWSAFRHFNDCDIRSSAITSCSNISDCTCATTGFGSDSFSVMYSDTSAAFTGGLASVRITNPAGNSDNFFVSSLGNLQVCDLIALWQPGSPQNCTLLMVTAIGTSNNKITHATSGCSGQAGIYNPSSIGGTYQTGSLVTRIGSLGVNAGQRYFSIDRSVSPPRLVTWVTANNNPSTDWANSSFEVVADGIEDMQIAWACDADDNGDLLEGANASARAVATTDEWFHNVASDGVPTCGSKPVAAVRITLVATSGQESGNAVPNARPSAEDRAAGSKTQHVRGRLTSIIRPRNIR